MAQKHYSNPYMSSDLPSGGHYRENAPSGGRETPRNTSFTSNLTFFLIFYVFFYQQMINFQAIWQCHMAKPYGKAIWQCHMAMPYGNAIWHCHMDRQGRDMGHGRGTGPGRDSEL